MRLASRKWAKESASISRSIAHFLRADDDAFDALVQEIRLCRLSP